MNAILSSSAIVSFVFAGAAFAQSTSPVHTMGEHPAVIVKRNAAKQGYDYVSKFYPHPAWLYLQSSATPDSAEDVAARKPARDEATMASAATTHAVIAGSNGNAAVNR